MLTYSPYFCSIESIHEAAQNMLELSLAHQTFFSLDLKKLDKLAEWIIALTKQQYPDFKIPIHSRWRHFEIKGKNRANFLAVLAQEERLKAELDLATVSVLLDAGAGNVWKYRDKFGDLYSRSEGLAVASLELFEQGFFSRDPHHPWMVEHKALQELDAESLGKKLLSNTDNKLNDIAARVGLLQKVVFPGARPGNLYELIHENLGKSFSAAELVKLLLLEGFNFNDIWEHRTLGIVPFHKLSLWLIFSFIEPLQRAGFIIHEMEKLPGLAEYRNGGLFLDGGVLLIKDINLLQQNWQINDPIVVEWRALTLALLEKLAQLIRDKTGLKAKALPLICILQGGTWLAGRQLAYQKRAGGQPPILCQTMGFF